MTWARVGRRGSAVGMEAIRGCALGRPSARDPSVRQIRVSRASDGASRARGVRSKGGTGTSALQRMGWGAKRPGTLAQGPTTRHQGGWSETNLDVPVQEKQAPCRSIFLISNRFKNTRSLQL